MFPAVRQTHAKRAQIETKQGVGSVWAGWVLQSGALA